MIDCNCRLALSCCPDMLVFGSGSSMMKNVEECYNEMG
jgi:hypothetical protein